MTESVFVARERELERLQSFLDKALAGHGQICFITGEAGVGKTALVTEFARRAQAEQTDLLVATGTCNAQTGVGDPYLPFREVLGLLTGDVEAKLAQRSITQENATRLRAFLRVSGQALVDLGPDLIDILVPGVGVATRAGAFLAGKVGWLDRLEELTARKAVGTAGTGLDQSRIFEQYTEVVKALAAQQPLILVLDDLHWADASSISLLFHLGRSIEQSHIMVIGTYRPEDVALGRGSSSIGSRQRERHPLESVTSELKRLHGDVWVNLGEVEEHEGQQFVNALVDAEPNRLGDNFRQALYERTEGHSLFTVELLRDMQERGDLIQDKEGRWVEGPTLDWDALPARIEGVVEERIGRLEAELREALVVASVEGEDFLAEVVARVQAVDERGLVRRLSGEAERQHRLVGAQGIERLGRQRLSLYQFRHNLFQKYLYSSLDEVERSYLHEDVGTVLETLYEDQIEEIAIQLARHFEEAGLAEKAIDYLIQAGQQAVRLSANQEAIAHLSKGLELVASLPESPHRIQQELLLQTTIGVALIATKGFGAAEVGEAYNRALKLCRQLGETPQIFPVLWGLWVFYLVRAELQTARELSEEMLQLGESTQDSALLVEGHWTLGDTLFWRGDLEAAREHLEQAVRLYDADRHQSHAYLYGQDPGVSALIYLSFTLWFLGYPDQALEQSKKSLALARQLEHPFSLAWALGCGAFLRHLRREVQETQDLAATTVEFATQHNHPFWLAAGTMLYGWTLTRQGRQQEGIEQMQQGLTIWRATGSEVAEPHFVGILAEALTEAGQVEEGLSLLGEALDQAQRSQEASSEIDLHRLKGELLLKTSTGDETEAELCFREAIGMARRHRAKSRELQAAMSLAPLWQKQGKGGEARQLLAGIYDWFSEGFGLTDLSEARTRLEEPA